MAGTPTAPDLSLGDSKGFRLNRIVRGALMLGLVAGVGGTGFVAGRRAVSTSPDAPQVAAPAVIVASVNTLVDQRPVQVTARWVSMDEVLYRRPGTITATSLSPANRVSIESGAELFRVDQVPVIAVPGVVPAFRDMGATVRGDDVAQLQGFLVSQGSTDLVVDGRWASATTRAWEAWQKTRGYAPQPNAPLGTVIFFPDFPVTVSASAGHRIGGLAGAGEVALSVLDPTPQFSLVAPSGSLPPPVGAPVEVTVGDTQLDFAVSATRSQGVEGTSETGLDSTVPLVCGSWCEALATSGPTPLSARATVAGPATGVVIPVGVIRTKAQGELFVIDASGSERPITIVLQVGSSAVVDGVEAGTSVEVPATVGG